jgi:DNA-directed RNA polymerase delta subunit
MGGLQYERIWDISGGRGWGLKKFSYDQNTGKLLTVFQKKSIDAKKDKGKGVEEVEGNAMDGNAVEVVEEGKGKKAVKSMKKGKGNATKKGKGNAMKKGKGKRNVAKKDEDNAMKSMKKGKGKKAVKSMKKGKGNKAIKSMKKD